MATNYFNSIYHHHHHSLRRRHSIDCPRSTFSSSSSYSFCLKQTTTTTTKTTNAPSVFHSIFATNSLSSTTSSTSPTPSTSQSISFDLLEQHLSSKNFRQADEETRRLLIILAGEAAQKRGYVFFSEVQFISEADLKAIDELWRKYSNNKYGYSVQKKIWNKASKDFTKFFLKVGWMKKLDTEVEQYNYRSFPTEFVWEMNDETPEGHLPLTNALRGIQLLNRILSHPAFQGDEEEEEEEEGGGAIVEEKGTENGGPRSSGQPPFGRGVFKPDYSF